MKRFARCLICGASVRTETENMPDHTRRVHAESHDSLKINPKYPPAARKLAMLENVREKASKDPEYLKELEDCMREGYF